MGKHSSRPTSFTDFFVEDSSSGLFLEIIFTSRIDSL
jgi:hypothetical protein